MSGFVCLDEFVELKKEEEYTLTLTYKEIGEPDEPVPGWDPYERSKETFRDASLAWEEYRRHKEKVGHSSLVCASLRRNGELIAMKANDGRSGPKGWREPPFSLTMGKLSERGIYQWR